MQRYVVLENLGKGTYGSVWKAVHKKSGESVAIKSLTKKYHNWSECMTLGELRSLQSLSKHQNIVQVYEVIRENDCRLHFVFEYMPDGNLYDLIQHFTRNLKSEHRRDTIKIFNHKIAHTMDEISSIVYQVLAGLSYVHSRGFVHRDIKPENLLLKGKICKLADFGMARKIGHDVHKTEPLTEYVSTRWYRAPELLLRSNRYGSPIDIFATGCVLAELITLKPMFPGKSELDQLCRIVCILGTPRSCGWTEGVELAKRSKFDFDVLININPEENWINLQKSKLNIKRLVPNQPPELASLLDDLLKINPEQRITAEDALKHQLFITNPVWGNEALLPVKVISPFNRFQYKQKSQNILRPKPVVKRWTFDEDNAYSLALQNKSSSEAHLEDFQLFPSENKLMDMERDCSHRKGLEKELLLHSSNMNNQETKFQISSPATSTYMLDSSFQYSNVTNSKHSQGYELDDMERDIFNTSKSPTMDNLKLRKKTIIPSTVITKQTFRNIPDDPILLDHFTNYRIAISTAQPSQKKIEINQITSLSMSETRYTNEFTKCLERRKHSNSLKENSQSDIFSDETTYTRNPRRSLHFAASRCINSSISKPYEKCKVFMTPKSISGTGFGKWKFR